MLYQDTVSVPADVEEGPGLVRVRLVSGTGKVAHAAEFKVTFRS